MNAQCKESDTKHYTLYESNEIKYEMGKSNPLALLVGM